MKRTGRITVPNAAVDIDVIVGVSAWAADLPTAEAVCRDAALATLAATERDGSRVDVAILLGDDDRIRALNRTFRGVDEPTDVLSFPSGEAVFLGDIAVAHGMAAADAARDSKPLSAHLSHLIVHAMLHLLGYDHETDDEAARMEALEIRVLADLGIANPYAAARDD